MDYNAEVIEIEDSDEEEAAGIDISEDDVKLELPDAQEKFSSILRRLKSKYKRQQFLEWIQFNWIDPMVSPKEDVREAVLDEIGDYLRSSWPKGTLDSEKFYEPECTPDHPDNPIHTVHVDAFMYDDSMVDDLVEKGTIPRSFCLDCGSKKTKPITYISHSASRATISTIFHVLLPPIKGKVILDIGSRTGVILCGAMLYSKPSKVIGVEMNADFCKIQRTLFEKYEFPKIYDIIEDDIMNRADVVREADIIIMNNVFEYFMPLAEQAKVWRFLRDTIKKGTLLISMPPLDEAFAKLPLADINLKEWVKEEPVYNADAPIPDLQKELDSMRLYKVL